MDPRTRTKLVVAIVITFLIIFHGIVVFSYVPPIPEFPTFPPQTYSPSLVIGVNQTHLWILCDDLNNSATYIVRVNETARWLDRPLFSEEEYFIVGQNNSAFEIKLMHDWIQVNVSLWEFQVGNDSVHYFLCDEQNVPYTHPYSYYSRFFNGFDVWISNTSIERILFYGWNYTSASYRLNYNTTQSYQFRVHYWYSEGKNTSEEYIKWGHSGALECDGGWAWIVWFATTEMNNATFFRWDLCVIYLGSDTFLRHYYYSVNVSGSPSPLNRVLGER